MNVKVELELRMDTASPNYSRSKGEQVKSLAQIEKYTNMSFPTDCPQCGRASFSKGGKDPCLPI